VRPLTLRHALGERKPLDRVFNFGPAPFGGDSATIAQGAVAFAEPTGNPVGVPNLRVVIDVGEWENSRWSLAGGQSGNPLSPHYSDLAARWQCADGIAIAWHPVSVERVARSTLVIRPV
jgi:penicillin amidase